MSVFSAALLLVVVAVTLAITFRAARRTKDRKQMYVAGGSITGFQNGVALTGEFLSAATFLGITGLYFTSGFDGLVYSIGAIMGWPVLQYLLSGKLRSMGRFTLTDVLNYTLQDQRIRLFASVATIIVLLFYMVAQMVGAGGVVESIFQIDFSIAVICVGILMLIYVVFGGMVATTWIQVVKAICLIAVGIGLVALILARFNFDLKEMFETAISVHPNGEGIMAASTLDTPAAILSAILTQTLGLAGLPHLAMRFFTVPDVASARKSATYATTFIGIFYVLMIVIGFGTIAILSNDPAYSTGPGHLIDGNNMAVVHLSHALGGNMLMSVCAAAIFATILAVVAGLTLAVAASVSHDIFSLIADESEQNEKREIKVFRISAFAFGAVSIGLSIVFKNENITFLVVTSLSVAASATFPLLFLACFWKPLTVHGALVGGITGLVVSIVGIIVGPTVWVAVFGFAEPIVPMQYPTLISMPIAFAVTIAVSLLGNGSSLQRAA